MTVSEFTSKAAHSQSETFKLGPDSVTVLSYFYRQREAYDDKFQNLRGALLETWRKCGRNTTEDAGISWAACRKWGSTASTRKARSTSNAIPRSPEEKA